MSKNIFIEISRSAIKHNLKIIKKTIGNSCILAPVVKANAYGHGLILTSQIMVEAGAKWICVNSIEEALKLRQNKIKVPLLIIGPSLPENAQLIIKSQSRVFVSSLELAKALNMAAKKSNETALIHLKIDTGMGRQGIIYTEALNFIKKINSFKHLKIEGIATHFATSDENKNNNHFLKQLKNFQETTKQIEIFLKRKLIKHCANSAATMLYPQARMDMCRVGIALYGCYPSFLVKKNWEKSHQPLKPVMSVNTKITQIKNVPVGSCLSYGCTYITKKPTKIAVLPVGYFDGLPRLISNRGQLFVKNKITPIIGRVCMNITLIDISNIKNVKIGDRVEIIGSHLTADKLAQKLQTINYEVLTNWKESIPRLIIK